MRTIKQYSKQRRLVKKILIAFRQVEPVTINFQMDVGVSSRYTTVQVNPNYYSVINVTNA